MNVDHAHTEGKRKVTRANKFFVAPRKKRRPRCLGAGRKKPMVTESTKALDFRVAIVHVSDDDTA